jgi:hypothetical protein
MNEDKLPVDADGDANWLTGRSATVLPWTLCAASTAAQASSCCLR